MAQPFNYPRCKTCRFYAHYVSPAGDERAECTCPEFAYGYYLEPKINSAVIENDEGWGWEMGPEFGCVHHEERTHAIDTSDSPE